MSEWAFRCLVCFLYGVLVGVCGFGILVEIAPTNPLTSEPFNP